MASNIQRLDREHHLTPFADWHALNAEGGRRIIESGAGVFVIDNAGQRILDGMSGLWNMPLGYSCLEVKQAIKTQLDKLPYYNSFFKTSNAPAAELSARLAQLCPGDISHFFYASSGSEAIDSAYRLLCRYWQIRGQAQKRIIVARKMAYHGSSVFGARLGGMAAMHAQIPEVLPVIQHIDNPYGYDLGKDYNNPEFGRQCAQQLETLIEKIGSANIAAFIGEPIQGAAGVYIPPDSYWPEIARICRQHDILLVSDEVICGFGRTGKHFGCEHWGVQPDMLVMAKGISNGYLPLSAVGLRQHLAETLQSDSAGEFTHGYTNSAHPTACAAALATLDYLRDNDIVNKVTEQLAPVFAAGLRSLQQSPLVGEVRSKGLIGAFELVEDKATRKRFGAEVDAGTKCRDNFLAAGAIMRACGQTMVSAPPLIISESELEELFARARRALRCTEAQLLA